MSVNYFRCFDHQGKAKFEISLSILSEFGLSVMDLNKDDNVTTAEMMDPECDAPPDTMDKNNDGKIQFQEFLAVVGAKKDTSPQQK
jgi:hypothetical protein